MLLDEARALVRGGIKSRKLLPEGFHPRDESVDPGEGGLGLRDKRASRMHDARLRQIGNDGAALDGALARIGLDDAGKHLHEGRLARAIDSGEGGLGPRAHVH
jgi:hypothetical protein